MKRTPFLSVREVLASPLTAAGRLMAVGRRLGNANDALGELLDAPLRDHVTVARLSGETLTLVADSPAWAARVRYQAPRILAHLRRTCDCPRLESMRVVTRPARVVREPLAEPAREARSRAISAETAELIESVALACDNDALRGTLLRLARRAKSRPSD